MMRKIFLFFFILLIFAVLGFTRDFIFKNTNIHLTAKLYAKNYPTHNIMDILQSFSYQTIYALKWVFTILFAFLYYFVQRLTLVRYIKSNFVKKWLNYMYIFLVILSAISLAIGWGLGDINKGYTFSRVFMGILQSPLPIMFLMPIAIATIKLKDENYN